MTDYVEEQTNEVEALQAIYPDEFELISEDPKIAQILVVGESGDESDPESDYVKVSCVVEFRLPPTYPDVVPEITITETSEELEGAGGVASELVTELEQQAGDNVGMVMIFTLASTAQERLHTLADALSQSRQEEREAGQRAKEEAERKKFEGTRVTIESFLAWKQKFDAERLTLALSRRKQDLTGKLTGKELFLKDSKLNESDLQFIEDGEEDVKIDESLFEDLDDLELEDDANLDAS